MIRDVLAKEHDFELMVYFLLNYIFTLYCITYAIVSSEFKCDFSKNNRPHTLSTSRSCIALSRSPSHISRKCLEGVSEVPCGLAHDTAGQLDVLL